MVVAEEYQVSVRMTDGIIVWVNVRVSQYVTARGKYRESVRADSTLY